MYATQQKCCLTVFQIPGENNTCDLALLINQYTTPQIKNQLGLVQHIFNLSTQEAEAGRFLISKPTCSTERVPRHQGVHREFLSQNKAETCRN